jgi:hypothetical protein
MKPRRNQCKIAIFWVFAFVLVQAIGKPMHHWVGCPGDCIGHAHVSSGCCAIDLHRSNHVSQIQHSHSNHCCHGHKAKLSKSAPIESPSCKASTCETAKSSVLNDPSRRLPNWSEPNGSHCSLCQWFSTPVLHLRTSAPNFIGVFFRMPLATLAESIPTLIPFSYDSRGPPASSAS